VPTNSHHLRPGIVHRLDKGTSGLLVVAKTEVGTARWDLWLVAGCGLARGPAALGCQAALPAAPPAAHHQSHPCAAAHAPPSTCQTQGSEAVPPPPAQVCHRHLCDQFKARTVSRIYWSITRGCPPSDSGRVETNIGRCGAGPRAEPCPWRPPGALRPRRPQPLVASCLGC
jgi:hypothetical protein